MKLVTKFALTSVAALTMAMSVSARENIQVAGSSTVLPFSSVAAEEFGAVFAQFNTPVVGSGGSGGGLRQFCQGVGVNTIDIANSSRAIRPAELQACRDNGVNEIIEVQIGYDGIVFASRIDAGDFELSTVHVFLAQAAQVPVNGQMVANPYTNWSQIDASLPSQEIILAIPGSNHGTREVYEELVVIEGCKTLPEVQALPKDDQNNFCLDMRTDGRIVEIAGDYTETLARLQAQKDAIGVFGLSFYESNRDRIKVATVNGVVPTIDNILAGTYPVARPLFFYVKGAHVGVIPGLLEFSEFFISEGNAGFGSPLEGAGLIPLSDAEREDITANIRAQKSL